jgi:cytoskeletal protein CcmA (bactofilin family)
VVRAKKITVAGVILGDIEALEEVRLLSTGRILGNITAPQLTMEPGVVVSGKINVTAGQKKDVDKLIEDAYSAGPAINFDGYFEEEKKKRGDKDKSKD